MAISELKPEETPEYYQMLADINLVHVKYLQAKLAKNQPKLSIKLKANKTPSTTKNSDETEEDDDPAKPHKCTTCHKGFARPHHLRRHMQTHETH